MKKVLGSMVLALAVLAMPAAMTLLTGCGSDTGKSEKIEGVEDKQPEGHEMEFKKGDDTEKPPENM